jgi:AMMECR1 domain-containing protein
LAFLDNSKSIVSNNKAKTSYNSRKGVFSKIKKRTQGPLCFAGFEQKKNFGAAHTGPPAQRQN